MGITMKPKSKENKERIKAINDTHIEVKISKLNVRSISEIVDNINQRMYS